MAIKKDMFYNLHTIDVLKWSFIWFNLMPYFPNYDVCSTELCCRSHKPCNLAIYRVWMSTRISHAHNISRISRVSTHIYRTNEYISPLIWLPMRPQCWPTYRVSQNSSARLHPVGGHCTLHLWLWCNNHSPKPMAHILWTYLQLFHAQWSLVSMRATFDFID